MTPEERTVVKKTIKEPWDPTQHIKTLYNQVKEGLETLADMRNNVGFQQEEFIEPGYMAIQQTGQFLKACERWKKLPI